MQIYSINVGVLPEDKITNNRKWILSRYIFSENLNLFSENPIVVICLTIV